jgi:translation initiation factor 6
VLGVETIPMDIGGFKTVGANNILTNKGFVINNRATDREKDEIDRLIGFKSERTTANTGSLSIGLSAVGNSTGVVAGENTTGYELNRIVNALNVE